MIDVVEVTHPGSVWAWSSEAKLRWLHARYGRQLRWRRVVADATTDIGAGPVRAAAPAIAPQDGLPLTPAAALERYRSLTTAELELLAGTQQPPLESVPLVTATTPLFVHPDDVESRAYRAWFPRAAGF